MSDSFVTSGVKLHQQKKKMSLKTYPNVVDSTHLEKFLNKRENSEVTPISMLTDKSISVKGYILEDFNAESF